MLCDTETSFAHRMQVYTGKEQNTAPETSQGKRVVLDLTEGLQGRTMVCDNFFTSLSLAEELRQRKMTLVGTIRKNKPELPPILLQVRRSTYTLILVFAAVCAGSVTLAFQRLSCVSP